MIYADKLRAIPRMDDLIAAAWRRTEGGYPHGVLAAALRSVVEETRNRLQDGKDADVREEALLETALHLLADRLAPGLQRVVNASGVVLHTNLGRAPLSQRAAALVGEVMTSYSSLEYDAIAGKRGSRTAAAVRRLCELTGAEDALIVNNNAAAVLLVLAGLAAGREVLISRGQLVEIGGSFRIPDVLKQSGARLVEVGTTNRTHLQDYGQAIGPESAAILKVHTSNYRIVGFTAQPDRRELAALAHQNGLPAIEDLGSGTLIPLTVGTEPTVRECLAAGMDVVTFSGDKLLGAGQAGLIAGRATYIAKLKQHPLLRALRIDKLSLAALEGTLIDYAAGCPCECIPVLKMLTAPPEKWRADARKLAERLAGVCGPAWQIEVVALASQAGGGSMPDEDLPGCGVAVGCGTRPEALAAALRANAIPVVARIQDGRVVFDVRCLLADDADVICAACAQIAGGNG